MNTRYCWIKRIVQKTSEETFQAIMSLIEHLGDTNRFPIETSGVRNIIGDGEAAFSSRFQQHLFNTLGITFYFNSSPFTYHNKILDRCVRTIRDAFGYRRFNNDDVFHMVDIYNNTYHKAIDCTPLEMMQDVNKEWQYIRYCMEKLTEVIKRQEHLHNYEYGNILAIHLEMQRTPQMFEKQRRYWNRLGRFIRYINGNVELDIYDRHGKITEKAVVPIYFTKFIADDYSSIPEEVRTTYQTLLPR
jgi:hypothetical protein